MRVMANLPRAFVLHETFGVVFVAIDDVTPFAGQEQERQHVAARCGGHQRFFRIDCLRRGEWATARPVGTPTPAP